MASACVNTAGISPELVLDCPPSYGWLNPRISFSDKPTNDPEHLPVTSDSRENPDTDASSKDLTDFEFLLDDPVAMLPADELFSGGRLMPLHLAAARPAADEIRSLELPETKKEGLRPTAVASSPRAPKCSSRWRELLGLKIKQDSTKAAGPAGSKNSNPNPRSLKQFLRRDPKSTSTDPSLNLPLLRESSDIEESTAFSSRRSLSSSSSSSSSQDHDDLPRLSLDTEKPCQIPIRNPQPPRVRVSRPRFSTPDRRPAARSSRSPVGRLPEAPPPMGAAVDSPRMNASGRVVFQGLERSSSSPGSFNGGPRVRNWAMERSYSAGVRITPVLNVPVFGLGQLFRKERESSSAARAVAGAGGGSTKNKIERERS